MYGRNTDRSFIGLAPPADLQRGGAKPTIQSGLATMLGLGTGLA